MNGEILSREIHAQPEALARFLAREGERTLALGAKLRQYAPRGLLIAARGSSDHVAVYAKYLLGARAGLVVALAAPSLVTLYGVEPKLEGWAVLAISQSGASPDVAEVVERARRAGAPTLAITDQAASRLAQAADSVIPLHLGGEQAVAATGSFTTSLLAIAHLAVGFAGAPAEGALAEAPMLAAAALDRERFARGAAQRLVDASVCALIGRGFGFPVALEWALKLKELTGIFAEPFSAADYRHGPIALASAGAPLFTLELPGATREDVVALAAELRRRSARVVRVSDAADAELQIPPAADWLAPIPAAIVGQMLAWHLAVARGRDPDRPPGIGKIARTL